MTNTVIEMIWLRAIRGGTRVEWQNMVTSFLKVSRERVNITGRKKAEAADTECKYTLFPTGETAID